MPGGRPSKYESTVTDLELVTNLALRGFTHEELAVFFKIDVATLYRWKNKHPEFREAIKKGGDEAIGKVAAALFKTATGFTKTVKKTFQSEKGPVEKEVETYYPPDKVAAFIYLKNRDRARWKDKWEEEIKESSGYKININIVKRSGGE